jgi:hypothetical protein
MEKQSYIEEKTNELELKAAEDEEKRNLYHIVESHYRDKLTFLKNLLRNERYENELEYQTKVHLLSKLQKDSKHHFQRRINQMFDTLSKVDERCELRNSEENQLENLLLDYYQKV